MSSWRFILSFAAQNSALHLPAGRRHITRHCIAHCKYSTDFAHSRIYAVRARKLPLLPVVRESTLCCCCCIDVRGRQTISVRCSMIAAALLLLELLLRSHSWHTDGGPVAALTGTYLWCLRAYTKIIHMFTAVLFSRCTCNLLRQQFCRDVMF